MTEEVKRYKSSPETHPFEYEDSAGTVIQYELRVISGLERDKYVKEIRKRTQKNAQGKLEVVDMDGLTAQILLLACRRNHGTTETPEWKTVLLAEIQSWPAPMQSDLNAIALKMSGLDAKATEEAKNG